MAEFLANDDEVVDAHKHTMYDLVANICHDGQPGLLQSNGCLDDVIMLSYL